MSPFVELKKTERNFQVLESVDKILEIIRENMNNLVLYVKYDIGKSVVQISQIFNNKSVSVITDPNFQPENNKIICYGLLNKYFEAELEITEIKGPGLFNCNIKKVKIAADVRKELRLKVTPEQVIASNFLISKHTIDVSNYKIPTSIKVLLDQFHSQNAHLGDIFKVDVFEQGSAVLEKIRKTKKIFYIEDTENPDVQAAAEDIMDAKELFGNSAKENIRKYVEKGYKSIIIAPIIYITDSGSSVPFAYVQLISKSKVFTPEDVRSIKKMLADLVTRIKDANTVLIQTNQQIVNLSRSGAKLYITDQDLKKYLKTTKGFVFNIIFKLQAPVTIYSEIKNVNLDEEGNLFVGVAFAGHSSRKDEMKRYYSFLDPIIKNYKDQLLKQRKKVIKP